eukprot:Sspe_Gene.90375::Locus_61944_Transcript_1_1_Confidence_1.000_Length_1071::g.90375::m.90375
MPSQGMEPSGEGADSSPEADGGTPRTPPVVDVEAEGVTDAGTAEIPSEPQLSGESEERTYVSSSVFSAATRRRYDLVLTALAASCFILCSVMYIRVFANDATMWTRCCSTSLCSVLDDESDGGECACPLPEALNGTEKGNCTVDDCPAMATVYFSSPQRIAFASGQFSLAVVSAAVAVLTAKADMQSLRLSCGIAAASSAGLLIAMAEWRTGVADCNRGTRLHWEVGTGLVAWTYIVVTISAAAAALSILTFIRFRTSAPPSEAEKEEEGPDLVPLPVHSDYRPSFVQGFSSRINSW